jgi:hypothetical protein
MDIKHLLPRAGPEATDSGVGSQYRRHAAHCTATCLPAEAVTTHRDTFVPMCRQVFGLADMDLAIRLLAPASQSPRTSACGCFRFRFTAAGQFRIYTGFPFKPDRRSRLDGHRRTQHIGCHEHGQPKTLCVSQGISRALQAAARALRGRNFFDEGREYGDPGMSKRVVVQFAGVDAYHLFQRADEDLAVADLAGSRGVLDRLHHAIELVVSDRHLQLDLG